MLTPVRRSGTPHGGGRGGRVPALTRCVVHHGPTARGRRRQLAPRRPSMAAMSTTARARSLEHDSDRQGGPGHRRRRRHRRRGRRALRTRRLASGGRRPRGRAGHRPSSSRWWPTCATSLSAATAVERAAGVGRTPRRGGQRCRRVDRRRQCRHHRGRVGPRARREPEGPVLRHHRRHRAPRRHGGLRGEPVERCGRAGQRRRGRVLRVEGRRLGRSPRRWRWNWRRRASG